VSELKGVYALLDRLPTEQRIALVLRRVEGMELAEIATAMKLSLATVKRRLVLAEARLERERERGAG
jgi:RNA polymerase sigma-70 factor (ECF subfamily)